MPFSFFDDDEEKVPSRITTPVGQPSPAQAFLEGLSVPLDQRTVKSLFVENPGPQYPAGEGTAMPSTEFSSENSPIDGVFQGSEAPAPLADVNEILGFAASAAHAGTVGFFGVDPDPSGVVGRFRAQHPVAGIMSEVAGTIPTFAIPFAGGAKGLSLGHRIAKRTPLLNRVLAFSQAEGEAVATKAAAREIARFAPLYAVSVGGGAAAQLAGVEGAENAFSTTVNRAAIDAAFIGGLSGAAARLARSSVARGPGAAKNEALLAELFGSEQELQRVLPGPRGYNPNGPPQNRLRALVDAENTEGARDILGAHEDTVSTVRRRLRDLIWGEQLGPGSAPHVRALVTEEGDKAAKGISNLFKPGKSKAKSVHRVIQNSKSKKVKDGLDEEDYARYREILNLSDDQLADIQFPRVIKILSDLGAKNTYKTLTRGMSRISERALLGREANGMFVVAIKTAGRVHKPIKYTKGRRKGQTDYRFINEAGDEWVLFKTTDPDKFFPKLGASRDSISREWHSLAARVAISESEKKVPFIRVAKRINNSIGSETEYVAYGLNGWWKAIDTRVGAYLDNLPPEAREQGIGQTISTLRGGFNAGRSQAIQAGQVLGSFLRPAITQFSRSARAVSILTRATAYHRVAEALARDKWFGTVNLDKRFSALRHSFGEPEEAANGLSALLRGFNKEEMIDLVRARELAIQPGTEEFKALAPNVRTYLRRWQKVVEKELAENKALAEHYGLNDDFFIEEEHLLFQGQLPGDFRVQIHSDADGIIGVVGGHDAKGAQKAAEDVIRKLAARGINAKVASKENAFSQYTQVKGVRSAEGAKGADFLQRGDLVFRNTRVDDVALQRAIDPASPGAQAFKQARKDLLEFEIQNNGLPAALRGTGFRNEATAKLKREIGNEALQGLLRGSRKRASVVADDMLKADLDLLREEFPDLWKQLNGVGGRLDQLAGKAGPFAQSVNDFADRTLGPMLGNNSATKIVNNLNRTMYNLTLGAGDVGFMTLNAITPIQTVMPEVAFVLGAPPERLARFYGTALTFAKDGKPRGLSYLDPIKVMTQAFKRFRTNKDHDMFARAIDEGIIAPKLIEEVTGTGSRIRVNFKDVLEGKDSISQFLLELSERGPAATESFSRGYAFTAGLELGENFLGLNGEKLYQFAAELTKRSMYGYATADRSRIITGPLGGLAGLFKNWSIHYIANMMTFGGELTKGNFAPFLYMMGGTGAITGVGGLAGYGMVDAFQSIFTDEPMMTQMYGAFGYGQGNQVQDAVLDTYQYGIPALMQLMPGIPGFTLQGRAAVPFSDPVRDVTQFMSIPIMDRASGMLDAIGDIIEQWQATGNHPAQSASAMDKLKRALLPRTFYKWMSFTQNGALKSLRSGNTLISNVVPSERTLHTMGITPVSFAKAFEINEFTRMSLEDRKDMTSAFGKALGELLVSGGRGEDMRRIILRAAEAGLPLDGVMASMEAHRQNRQLDMLDRLGTDPELIAMRRKTGLGF